jgi:peptide/nickel transport system ATP-binding protein
MTSTTTAARPSVLNVRSLSIEYRTRRGPVHALRDVSLEVRRGEALALIGESGSGKTTLGLSIVRLLAGGAVVRGGEIHYEPRRANRAQRTGHSEQTNQRTNEQRARDAQAGTGRPIDVLRLDARELRRFRWRECAMVFQAALNAFNPVLRVADHFADTARAHGSLQGRALRERAAALLRLVRLDPERVWRAYPHELSGGMRQRALIALALLLEPQLLILDEPTTALDLLTQRTIIDVLAELRATLDVALIFISHDLALAAELADRTATMYAGRIVEIGDVRTIFHAPRHPYTIGLIGAVPTLADRREQLASIPGAPPDLIDLPSGCAFHPRCPLAEPRCIAHDPPLLPVGPGHQAACWRWYETPGALARKEPRP